MPSSSSSAGLSARGAISSYWNTTAMRRRISSSEKDERSKRMAFEVPPLPYDYVALAPTIDEQTMRLHHDKHHQAYVDHANAALAGTQWADKSVEHVLVELVLLPEEVRAAVRNLAC